MKILHNTLFETLNNCRARELFSKGGSRLSKQQKLDQNVFQEFCEWKKQRMIVHARDLVDCALKHAEFLRLRKFKASPAWLHKFKKKHRIVSRRITTFLTKKQIAEVKSSESIINDFRIKVKQALRTHHHSKVFCCKIGILYLISFRFTILIKRE